MLAHVLVTIVCLIGFIYALWRENLYSRVWTGIIFLGYGMLMFVFLGGFRIENYFGISILIFFAGQFGLASLHMMEKEVDGNHKFLILLLAVFGFLPSLFRIMHWPGAGLLSALAIFPLIFLTVSLVRKRISKNQLHSGIIIFGSLCLIHLMGMMLFWLNLK